MQFSKKWVKSSEFLIIGGGNPGPMKGLVPPPTSEVISPALISKKLFLLCRGVADGGSGVS